MSEIKELSIISSKCELELSDTIEVYKDRIAREIAGINIELETDEDFAKAKEDIKFIDKFRLAMKELDDKVTNSMNPLKEFKEFKTEIVSMLNGKKRYLKAQIDEKRKIIIDEHINNGWVALMNEISEQGLQSDESLLPSKELFVAEAIKSIGTSSKLSSIDSRIATVKDKVFLSFLKEHALKDKERLEKERLEKERLEKERLEKERLEKEMRAKIEGERALKEKEEAQRRLEIEGERALKEKEELEAHDNPKIEVNPKTAFSQRGKTYKGIIKNIPANKVDELNQAVTEIFKLEIEFEVEK